MLLKRRLLTNILCNLGDINKLYFTLSDSIVTVLKALTVNMCFKYNIFACVSKNMGIGKDNTLPWSLPNELQYYLNISKPKDGKKNVYILGRKTWDGLPESFLALPNRIYFVLSRSHLEFGSHADVYGFNNWDQIVAKLKNPEFKNEYESIWVIGGTEIYREAMDSKYFYRLFLTKLDQEFESDVFFPPLVPNIRKISVPEVSEEIQEENGVNYTFNVYENTLYKEDL